VTYTRANAGAGRDDERAGARSVASFQKWPRFRAGLRALITLGPEAAKGGKFGRRKLVRATRRVLPHSAESIPVQRPKNYLLSRRYLPRGALFLITRPFRHQCFASGAMYEISLRSARLVVESVKEREREGGIRRAGLSLIILHRYAIDLDLKRFLSSVLNSFFAGSSRTRLLIPEEISLRGRPLGRRKFKWLGNWPRVNRRQCCPASPPAESLPAVLSAFIAIAVSSHLVSAAT